MKTYSPDPATQQAFVSEVTRYMFSINGVVIASGMMVAALLLITLWQTSPPQRLLGWFVVIELAYLGRALLTLRYWKARHKNATHWLFWLRTSIVLSGLLWGSVSSLFFPPHDVLRQSALIFLSAGIAASATSFYAIDTRLLFSFLIPLLLPLTFRLLLEGSPQSLMLGGMLLTFLAYLMLSSRRSAGGITENIHLRLEATKREAIVREQKEFLNAILETEPECVSVTASNGDILLINQVGLSMLEVDSADEAQQLGLVSFVLPEYREAFLALNRRARAGHAGSLEFALRGKNGTLRWLETHATPLHFGKNHSSLLAVTRDISSQKCYQKELERQAHIDYLTGLNNRGHFTQQAEQELARALRYGSSLSILLLDIDFFKCINDNHGHKTGDLALKKLAEVSLQTLRDMDIIGRIGGEEFAILLPETDAAEALGVAERLRLAVAAINIPLEGRAPLQFTVSIGLATLSFLPPGNVNLDAFLSLADCALYQAKNAGRNCVIVACEA